MRQAVLRMGESLSPRAVGLSVAATAGLFGLSQWIRHRDDAKRKEATAAPFVPDADVPVPAAAAGASAGSSSGASPEPVSAPAPAALTAKDGDAAEEGASTAVEQEGSPAAAADEDDEAVPEHLIRREERPEDDRDPHCGAITRVVYDSFDELVLSGDAANIDVLLLVHQEGCSACGALAPRLRMIAKMLNGMPAGKKVRIAMLNGTQNNPLPDAINTRAFPRLVAFPKGEKSSPVLIRMLEKEEGGRAGLPTVEDILDFLEGTSGTRFRVTPRMRAEAPGMERECSTLNLLLLRADNLLGVGLALASVEKERGGGEAADKPADGPFARALERYTKRVMLVHEACHALADSGQAPALERFVGKCEASLVKLARSVDVRPAPPGEDGEEQPAMGPALMRMLFVYERSAHMWGEDAPPQYAPMLERCDLRLLAAKAELLDRLEADRRAGPADRA